MVKWPKGKYSRRRKEARDKAVKSAKDAAKTRHKKGKKAG